MTVRILTGDCRDVLRTLPDESVHCCISSPPYWGLRDYGIGTENGELGLEPTLAEHVATMVDVFREVRRVLRKDGTLWLNYGDSYATGAGKVGDCPGGGAQGARWRGEGSKHDYGIGPIIQPNRMPQDGLKPKDLCGVPWRVAFALQADGWWLRSDIILSKLNPMPESCVDRPTKSHEYLFLLTKSPRYYYDNIAIAERSQSQVSEQSTRNRRTVWSYATEAFRDLHFATMPTFVVDLCIKAGTSEKGCCAKCGAPWVRKVEKTRTFESGSGRSGNMPNGKNGSNLQGGGATLDIRRGPCVSSETLGWSQSCSCKWRFEGQEFPACPVACTVLDPFGGAGTVGLVADRLGRNAVLIELNPQYAEMARKRLTNDAGLFADVGTYNGTDDFAKSLDVGYAHIRQRVANGGPGWEPKPCSAASEREA